MAQTAAADPRAQHGSPPPWCHAGAGAAGVLRPARRGWRSPRGASLGRSSPGRRPTDYDLRFMVALVPALPDPRMDQALDAIQRGFAHSKNRQPGGSPPAPDEYLLDRVWLPWLERRGRRRRSRLPQAPGILLFRGSNPRSLELVFLVPETSKMGIQKDTFREALELIAGLQDAALEPEVAILGPSFSGSVESLRLALLELGTGAGAGGSVLGFQAASGSATADGLEAVFDEMQVGFCRTVLPDSVLQDRALGFLSQRWAGTSAGSACWSRTTRSTARASLATGEGQPGGGAGGRRRSWCCSPSRAISRTSAPPGRTEQKTPEGGEPANPLQVARRALGLDLSGREQEWTWCPPSARRRPRSTTCCSPTCCRRSRARGSATSASSSTDSDGQALPGREAAPARARRGPVHVRQQPPLRPSRPRRGRSTACSSSGAIPLFTEGAPGLPRLAADAAARAWQQQRRQFGSEYQQGVFEAARYLLRASPLPAPQAWIAAVGNGSLWPIARLPVAAKRSRARSVFCGRSAPGDPTRSAGQETPGASPWRDGFDGKDDLQILLVAGLLCLLAAGLRRAALLEEVAGAPLDPDDRPPIHDVRGNRAC